MEQNENMHDFVFLTHWYDVIKAYDDAGQQDIANAIAKEIIVYGVTGQTTTGNPFVSSLVRGMCQRANARSKKGGRPPKYDRAKMIELHSHGLTDQEVANNLGCTLKTVQRALANADPDDEI